MNALGHDLPNRVYGPDLMAKLLRAQRADRRADVPLRRPQPGRARPARAQPAPALPGPADRRRLLAALPHAHADEEIDAVVAEINRAGADVVWVGIGVPKQEKWMAAMRDRLDAPVLVGVGAAFDFHAGLVPQAPGLDAVARPGVGSSASPRSRAGCGGATSRYNPRFVFGFARQYVRHRRARASARQLRR